MVLPPLFLAAMLDIKQFLFLLYIFFLDLYPKRKGNGRSFRTDLDGFERLAIDNTQRDFSHAHRIHLKATRIGIVLKILHFIARQKRSHLRKIVPIGQLGIDILRRSVNVFYRTDKFVHNQIPQLAGSLRHSFKVSTSEAAI